MRVLKTARGKCDVAFSPDYRAIAAVVEVRLFLWNLDSPTLTPGGRGRHLRLGSLASMAGNPLATQRLLPYDRDPARRNS